MTAWETIRDTPRRLGEAATGGRPHLRSIISPPRRMSPVGFAMSMVALLVAGMVGMLVLSTALQNQAFEVRAAQRSASELGYRTSDLETQVGRLRAPATLGAKAAALGMVPNTHSVFIDLATGDVLGEPVAATGHDMPALTRNRVTAQTTESSAPATEASTTPEAPAADEPEPVAEETEVAP